MIEEKVLARVNGREITIEDVQLFINSLSVDMQRQFNSQEGMERIAEELVSQELLYADAVDRKLDQDQAFQKQRRIAEESLLKQYAMSLLMNQIQPTHTEVEEYYDSHKMYFAAPEQVTASHILVQTEEEAQNAKDRVDGGEAFETVAAEISLCPSREQGGSLGTFSPDQMVPEFAEAVRSMEVGTISGPIQSQFGYHIIHLVDKVESQSLPHEDAQNEARRQLTAMKQQELYLETIEGLKQKYHVEKYYGKENPVE
ncbi:MAG: peptidylprolyl isomerase [Tissierellia bacterium]|nr:peptidylprolyl isomerase [Tissierellia bacterium]